MIDIRPRQWFKVVFHHPCLLYQLLLPTIVSSICQPRLIQSKRQYNKLEDSKLEGYNEDEPVKMNEGFWLFLNPRDRLISRSMYLKRTWEEAQTCVFKHVTRLGMNVVDVGANIGYYTVLASKLVGNRGRVYAFEPEPYNYRLLIRNIKLNNCDNVIAFKYIVSDRMGKEKLYLSDTNPGNHRSWDSGEKRRVTEVQQVPLDSLLDPTHPIHVVKIDVQGSEMQVLQGMQKILKTNPQIKIILEFWPQGLAMTGVKPKALFDLMTYYGFSIQEITEHGLKDLRLSRFFPYRLMNLYLEKHGCRQVKNAPGSD